MTMGPAMDDRDRLLRLESMLSGLLRYGALIASAWIAARQGAPDCVDGRWEGLISECLMRDVQLRLLDRDPVTV